MGALVDENLNLSRVQHALEQWLKTGTVLIGIAEMCMDDVSQRERARALKTALEPLHRAVEQMTKE